MANKNDVMAVNLQMNWMPLNIELCDVHWLQWALPDFHSRRHRRSKVAAAAVATASALQ